MYAYCGNNPVNRIDFTGEAWWNPADWDWATIADVAVTVVSALSALSVSLNSGSAYLGWIVNGISNNSVNFLYYTFSDRAVNLEAGKEISSYVTEENGYQYINRWDRLDNARYQTQESYFGGGWAYYSEYSLHMYGWAATSWAYDNDDVPIFFKIASSSRFANIDSVIDKRPEVMIPTILYGIVWGG